MVFVCVFLISLDFFVLDEMIEGFDDNMVLDVLEWFFLFWGKVVVLMIVYKCWEIEIVDYVLFL